MQPSESTSDAPPFVVLAFRRSNRWLTAMGVVLLVQLAITAGLSWFMIPGVIAQAPPSTAIVFLLMAAVYVAGFLVPLLGVMGLHRASARLARGPTRSNLVQAVKAFRNLWWSGFAGLAIITLGSWLWWGRLFMTGRA